MPMDAPVYREPSTYEMMVKCELKAGETRAASEIVRMAEQRAFPPAGELLFKLERVFRKVTDSVFRSALTVIARLQRLLTDVGAVSLL